jgi:hypothetical protein
MPVLFSAIAKVRSCEVDLFLSGEEFRDLRENSRSDKKKITFVVSAAFYGRSQAANKVGHILSKARIYLQDPKNYRQGVSRYKNPHKLHFGDSTEIFISRIPKLPPETATSLLHELEKLGLECDEERVANFYVRYIFP